jgi:hypothetical protein
MLTASPERLSHSKPGRFRRGWLGVVGVSLLAGLAAMAIHGLAWRIFGERGIVSLPSLAAAGVMVAGPMRRGMVELSRRLGGQSPAGQALVATLLGLLLVGGISSLQPLFYKADPQIPAWLAWIRPAAKTHRVLLLMPLWGAWGMLAIGQFCRPGQSTCPAVTSLIRGCGPLVVAVLMGLLMFLTIQAMGFLPWWQVGITAATIAGGLIAGMASCRQSGGPSAGALQATGTMTQLVFLLAAVAGENLLIS